MHVHEEINTLFPVRNSEEQKKAFRDWTVERIQNLGYQAAHEPADVKWKSQNIVVGNVDTARVIFTAHYDTPRRGLVPNLMMPRCIWAQILYVMLIVVPLLFVSIVLQILVDTATGNPVLGLMAYFVSYFGAFYLLMLGVKPNPHNANDNTSGCAALFSIMELLAENDRDDVAFVFFDNEEKGLVGSRVFAKMHPEVKKNGLVINLDCVGYGDQVLSIAGKQAAAAPEFAVMKETCPPSERLTVHFFGPKGSMMNSDQKNFARGIGICACKKAPVIRFACGRIHTPRDTEADADNMDFLADWMVRFVRAFRDGPQLPTGM